MENLKTGDDLVVDPNKNMYLYGSRATQISETILVKLRESNESAKNEIVMVDSSRVVYSMYRKHLPEGLLETVYNDEATAARELQATINERRKYLIPFKLKGVDDAIDTNQITVFISRPSEVLYPIIEEIFNDGYALRMNVILSTKILIGADEDYVSQNDYFINANDKDESMLLADAKDWLLANPRNFLIDGPNYDHKISQAEPK